MTPKDIADARKLMQTAKWRIAVHERYGRIVDGICSEGAGEKADEPDLMKLCLGPKTGDENIRLIVWAMKHLPELLDTWELHHEYLNTPVAKLIEKTRAETFDECAEAVAGFVDVAGFDHDSIQASDVILTLKRSKGSV